MSKSYHGLHVIVDDDVRWSRDPIAQAEAACAGGARVLQLRAKTAPDRQVLHWARIIRELTREAGVLFVLNDRFDIALLAEADAVHLGQEDISPGQIPTEIRQALDIGRSTHDREQAEKALDDGVRYIGYGPVFGTRSKSTPYSARGIDGLAEVAAAVKPLPVIAIGGIGATAANDVRSAGAAGIAVISSVAASADPAEATREIAKAFASGYEAPA